MTNSKIEFDITFVHTGEVHVATFNSLIESTDPTLSVNHIVNSNLLDRAMKQQNRAELETEIHSIMQLAAQESRLVVCTCSSIGEMAETTPVVPKGVVTRVDRPMAEQAVKIGGNVLVVAALESTLAPTLDLLNAIKLQCESDVTFDVLCVTEAWQYFERGDSQRYIELIAQAIESEKGEYNAIVLAQASMAKVSERLNCWKIPILSSPRLGVEVAVKNINNYK
ncbi:hypothetical protein [Aliivibrio kagoshimensis]|uniref:hypothetical protein n=1 Tax=Aliivibrio kagoshimensis TaxID=2910230 RepID=UPI003D116861